jgi:hypothetical protein
MCRSQLGADASLVLMTRFADDVSMPASCRYQLGADDPIFRLCRCRLDADQLTFRLGAVTLPIETTQFAMTASRQNHCPLRLLPTTHYYLPPASIPGLRQLSEADL